MQEWIEHGIDKRLMLRFPTANGTIRKDRLCHQVKR